MHVTTLQIPLIFQFPIGFAFWAVYFGAFWREYKIIRAARAATVDRSQDRGSLQVIIRTQMVSGFVAFFIAFLWSAAAIRTGRVAAYWVGIATLIAGAALRRHCFAMLASQFRGEVRVNEGDAIVERGAYRFVRHPSYTAAFLLYLGIGLALGNWASVALLEIVAAFAYGYRIRVEERALRAVHGERYAAYQARTWRFVPYVI